MKGKGGDEKASKNAKGIHCKMAMLAVVWLQCKIKTFTKILSVLTRYVLLYEKFFLILYFAFNHKIDWLLHNILTPRSKTSFFNNR